MRKIRDVLHYRQTTDLSLEAIGRALGLSKGVVAKYLGAISCAGVDLTQALALDDWALAPIGQIERNDLLEIVDDRVNSRATRITSQLPVDHWHAYLDDPTLADAILDRVVHAAHRLELAGESLRTPPKSKGAGKAATQGTTQ